MKGRLWGLWTAAVAALSLAAMAVCALPSGADYARLAQLPPVVVASAAPATEERIDINTADAETLMELPGIGEVRAAAILQYREENGPFRYPEELLYVPGIGEGTLDKILDRITAGGG